MKNFYTLLFLLVLSISLLAQQNPCPPTGVTTDPGAPVNNLHPNYINDYFDWTQELYNVNFVGGAVQVQANPYAVNNGGVTNLYQSGDYQPEDGWELLYVDFGLDKFGDPLPPAVGSGQLFFVLYNKFRSIIRVFVAIDQLNQNNLIEVMLQIEGDYNTALLGSINKLQQPLKNFDPAAVASNVQKYTNGATYVKHWHYADFPVSYDPCTCEPPISNPSGESNLKFEVNLIDEAIIELKGFSNGTVQIMAEKSSPGASGSANWDDFYGTVKKAGELIETGKKGYKSFNIFKTDAKNTASGKDKEIEMKAGIDNLGSYLTNNVPELKAVPYISEALSIIDFFVGGSKKDGPQQVTFPPMSVQLEHSFSGSIKANYNYVRKPLFTPGSSFTPNNQQYSFGDDRYPIYNEILGVFTLLDKPEIEVYSGYVKYENSLTIPLKQKIRKLFVVDDESIKIAINPASNLSLSEAYYQLNISLFSTEFIKETTGGSIVNDTLWVSNMIPLGCSEDNPIIIDEEIIIKPFSSPAEVLNPIIKFDLSVILVFENSKGDKFLHKATWAGPDWDIVISATPYPYAPDYSGPGSSPTYLLKEYDWFSKPLFAHMNTGSLGAPENLSVKNSTIDKDLVARETITIENSTITATAVHPVNPGFTNVIAGHTIDILPESEILPNSDLQINPLGISCDGTITLATTSEINSICNSTDYQGQKIQAKIGLDYGVDVNVNSLMSFIAFPNPANSFINIALSENFIEVNEIEVEVLDVVGSSSHINKRLTKTDGFFVLETAQLSSGIYLLQVQAEDKRSVKKIFID